MSELLDFVYTDARYATRHSPFPKIGRDISEASTLHKGPTNALMSGVYIMAKDLQGRTIVCGIFDLSIKISELGLGEGICEQCCFLTLANNFGALDSALFRELSGLCSTADRSSIVILASLFHRPGLHISILEIVSMQQSTGLPRPETHLLVLIDSSSARGVWHALVKY